MSFQDLFSEHAEAYARHRPVYPGAIYDFLAGLAPSLDCAWDCGTGTGQVARELIGRFRRVVATDGSAEQIRNAHQHERIQYRVEPAEATSIEPASIDLITVGTAVHWFDFDRFFAEVRRVSKPGAVLAVWTYHLPDILPLVDQWIEKYYRVTLAKYWPERISYLDKKYETLPFPFPEIEAPEFVMEAEWDLPCLAGFLGSWSATRRFVKAAGMEVFEAQMTDLERRWGDPAKKRWVRWPLFFRIGRAG